MTPRFHCLASGSRGNACIVETARGGLLLDFGLRIDVLESLFRSIGISFDNLRAALLTHTHSDHWHSSVLNRLFELRIPLFCHPGHRELLQLRSDSFVPMALRGLVRYYEQCKRFSPIPDLRCLPIPLSHDGGDTFGFRIDHANGGPSFKTEWSLGYAADLGSWDAQFASRLANVDCLALEFNHDLELLRRSNRPTWLIHRILGNHGHLSNSQGARLLKEILTASTPGQLRSLFLLHLSSDCNSPDLAHQAATLIQQEMAAFDARHQFEIIATSQIGDENR